MRAAQKRLIDDAQPAQTRPSRVDFSEFAEDDLRTLRKVISDELRVRKAEIEEPWPVGSQVKVNFGSRRGLIGTVALRMANKTYLIQFGKGGLSRIHQSRLTIMKKEKKA